MKQLYFMGIALLLIITPAHAADWIIDDSYIGGGYYTDQYEPEDVEAFYHNEGDVIAASADHTELFDIDEMTVNIDNSGNVTVSIVTDYTETSKIKYGDLFISTNGWTPHGDSPYMEDTIFTGETWEYVFDTNAFVSSTGENPIYNTITGTLVTSDDLLSNEADSFYRHDQEVQFSAGDPDNFSGTGYFYNDVEGFLTYTFNLDDMGLSADEAQDLGFRWAMTCANDVIEGGVHWEPVPEPGTMILLGMGILGLGAVGRKKLSGLS